MSSFTRRSSVPLSSGIPFSPASRATGPSFSAFSRAQHIPLNSSTCNNSSNSSGNRINSSIPWQRSFNGYNAGRKLYSSSQPSAASTYFEMGGRFPRTSMGTSPNFRVAQVPAAWATGTEPSNLTSNQSDTANNHRQTASQNESSFWNMPIQRTSGMADSSKSVKDMYKDWLSGQEEDARIIFNERTGEVEQSQDEAIESAQRTDNVMSRAQRALALISTHVGQFSDESLKTDVATLSSLVDELSRDLVAERASGRTLEENQIRTTNAACRARRLAEERAKVDSDPDLARSRNLWQTYKRFVPRSERCEYKHHHD